VGEGLLTGFTGNIRKRLYRIEKNIKNRGVIQFLKKLNAIEIKIKNRKN